MPQKSKSAKQKAAGIANAHASHHPYQISDSILIPDAKMNNDIISQSLSIKVISDLGNEYISEGIAFEGPRDSPLGLEGGWDQLDLSGVKIDQYFEFVDEDDKLSELEGEELQQSLRLVMEDQMGRVEQRKTKDSHLMRLYCRVHLQLIGRKQRLGI